MSLHPSLKPALLRLRCWLLLLALLPALAAQAQVVGVPPRPDPPRLVNDLAGLLQPQEVAALEQKLLAYNDSTSSQVAIVTVPDLGGNDIFDYGQQLFESWGIGQKGKNNGILILVAKQERRVNIHTGSGMEGAVPDALAKRIISNTLQPAFEKNQYYTGLDRATDQLFALAKGEYKADPNDAQGSRDSSGSGWPFWLIIGVLILFVVLSLAGWRARGERWRVHPAHHLRRLFGGPGRLRRGRRRLGRRRGRRWFWRLRGRQQRRWRRQRQLVAAGCAWLPRN